MSDAKSESEARMKQNSYTWMICSWRDLHLGPRVCNRTYNKVFADTETAPCVSPNSISERRCTAADSSMNLFS